MLKSLYRWATKALAERSTGVPRSPEWHKVEQAFLKGNPTCAACGSSAKLQVHHMMPFHLDQAKELDPKNLITLCMDVNECHLKVGHGDNWRAYNPNVFKDASDALSGAKTLSQVITEAKQNRVL